MASTEGQIRLISADNREFCAKKSVATMSGLVSHLLEVDSSDAQIALKNVKGAILEQILAFCEYHVNQPFPEIEKPLPCDKIENCVPKWDADFIMQFDQDTLMDIVISANYLEVYPLVELCCATVASMLRSKTPEEIREKFKIMNDFTPEEEAKNPWILPILMALLAVLRRLMTPTPHTAVQEQSAPPHPSSEVPAPPSEQDDDDDTQQETEESKKEKSSSPVRRRPRKEE